MGAGLSEPPGTGVSEEAARWGRADMGSIPRLAADLLGDCGVAH